jgi:hypothetical protein
MQKILLILLTSFFAVNTFAQPPKEYSENIREAEKYYAGKDFKKSAEYYAKAFMVLGNKGYPNDRYNAACSWALAGNADSAFHQLERIVNNYTNLNHITTDRDLVGLYNDARWDKIIAQVKANKEKAEEKLNKPLVRILDTIHIEDQKYRKQLDEVEQKYGRESQEIKELWRTIEEKDSINLVKVTAILDKYGWLGADEVGSQGNQTIFLVIQHADITTQKKYLPMMREAVKQKKAQANALALLEDRVALREGRKQIYGSQIGREKDGTYYISALEDPDNVDKRRAQVGLQPLADYVRNWQIQWDVEAYKKQLPELEKKLAKEKD